MRISWRVFVQSILVASVFGVVSCGGSDRSDGDLVYFIKVSEGEIDDGSFDDESVVSLTEKPEIRNSDDGSGTIVFKTAHGTYVSEFISHLATEREIDALEVVEARMIADTERTVLSRTRLSSSTLQNVLVVGSPTSAHVEFTYSFQDAAVSLEETSKIERAVSFEREAVALPKRILKIDGLLGEITQDPFEAYTEVSSYTLNLSGTSTSGARPPALVLELPNIGLLAQLEQLEVDPASPRPRSFVLSEIDPASGRVTMQFSSLETLVSGPTFRSGDDGESISVQFFPFYIVTTTFPPPNANTPPKSVCVNLISRPLSCDKSE